MACERFFIKWPSWRNLCINRIWNYFCKVGHFFQIITFENYAMPTKWMHFRVYNTYMHPKWKITTTNFTHKITIQKYKQWIAANVPINGSQISNLAAKPKCQFYIIVAGQMHRFVVLAVWWQFIERKRERGKKLTS